MTLILLSGFHVLFFDFRSGKAFLGIVLFVISWTFDNLIATAAAVWLFLLSVILTAELEIYTSWIRNEQLPSCSVYLRTSDVTIRIDQCIRDIGDGDLTILVAMEVVALNVDPVLLGLGGQIECLELQAIYLLLFGRFNLLFREGIAVVLLHEFFQKLIDPRLKKVWTMIAGLNKDLSTEDLELTVEACLDNVAKLLLVSQLLETRLIQQREEHSQDGTFFIRVLSQLEVGHNG